MKNQSSSRPTARFNWGVIASAGSAAVVVLLASSFTANAAIKCKGRFQVIKGQGLLSTPYCEDNYLAAIARSYGRKVSNRTIRQNPGVKAQVCRHIGHDSRLTDICSNHRPGSSRRPF